MINISSGSKATGHSTLNGVRSPLLKLKNIKVKKAKVKIKKVSGAAGYQVVYADNSKFKKPKTKTITETAVTLPKLKKSKTYYVKVRAYKKDSTGKKVYGKYSNVSKVRIKK